MLTYYPYVPIATSMGIGCAIQSYNQVLYLGLTADLKSAPDVDRLQKFIDQSFRELLQHATGVKKKPRRTAGVSEPAAVTPIPLPIEPRAAVSLAAAGD